MAPAYVVCLSALMLCTPAGGNPYMLLPKIASEVAPYVLKPIATKLLPRLAGSAIDMFLPKSTAALPSLGFKPPQDHEEGLHISTKHDVDIGGNTMVNLKHLMKMEWDVGSGFQHLMDNFGPAVLNSFMSVSSDAFGLTTWALNLHALKVFIQTLGAPGLYLLDKTLQRFVSGSQAVFSKITYWLGVHTNQQVIETYLKCYPICKVDTFGEDNKCLADCQAGVLKGCKGDEACIDDVIYSGYFSLLQVTSEYAVPSPMSVFSPKNIKSFLESPCQSMWACAQVQRIFGYFIEEVREKTSAAAQVMLDGAKRVGTAFANVMSRIGNVGAQFMALASEWTAPAIFYFRETVVSLFESARTKFWNAKGWVSQWSQLTLARGQDFVNEVFGWLIKTYRLVDGLWMAWVSGKDSFKTLLTQLINKGRYVVEPSEVTIMMKERMLSTADALAKEETNGAVCITVAMNIAEEELREKETNPSDERLLRKASTIEGIFDKGVCRIKGEHHCNQKSKPWWSSEINKGVKEECLIEWQSSMADILGERSTNRVHLEKGKADPWKQHNRRDALLSADLMDYYEPKSEL